MTISPNLGRTLLAIYLVIIGLSGIFGLSFGALSFLVPLLALIAGVVLFMGH